MQHFSILLILHWDDEALTLFIKMKTDGFMNSSDVLVNLEICWHIH